MFLSYSPPPNLSFRLSSMAPFLLSSSQIKGGRSWAEILNGPLFSTSTHIPGSSFLFWTLSGQSELLSSLCIACEDNADSLNTDWYKRIVGRDSVCKGRLFSSPISSQPKNCILACLYFLTSKYLFKNIYYAPVPVRSCASL